MRYFLAIIFITTTMNCFGQDYNTLISQHRKSYMDDFLKDQNSPLKKDDLKFLRFYNADSTYRITAKVEILANEAAFVMPVFSGTGQQYIRYAALKFMLKGKPVKMIVYRDIALSKNLQYKDYLFLPFTDATNGNATYGGGRYIDLSEADLRDGSVVIDFNKAYNPYCAYSEGYACPRPPDENRTEIAVEAGEKMFAGEKKH
jgi:uncharacterized protein (DUF1684 family)